MSDTRVPELSVVIPVFNEELSVGPLHAEIEQALADFDYEVLYIDDGSTDKSFSVLTDIQIKTSNVRLIRFRRNFGRWLLCWHLRRVSLRVGIMLPPGGWAPRDHEHEVVESNERGKNDDDDPNSLLASVTTN